MSSEPIAGARARGPALTVVLLVLLLTFLDTTIVSVALGSLESNLSAGVISLQWVVDAYAVVFASFMLIGGTLADRYGRRRVMLGGVVLFAVGSLVCALAPHVGLVIAGRAVMGLGAAACEPGTLSIIRQLYPDRRARARALGAWSAVSGLALAAGPVVGGVLVAAGSWRSIFWFSLALGAVLAAAVAVFVPESRGPATGSLDVAGVVLIALGIGCTIYAAIAGQYQGYATSWVIALFVVGGLALITFVLVERRGRSPMLDLSLIARPTVGTALFAAFAAYFAVFAIFFSTALYLDIAQAYSGAELAGMFTPMAVAIVGGSLATGPWVARRGTRLPTVLGCVVAAIGMVLARHELGAGAGLSFGLLALALAIAGLGFGVTVVPLTSAVLTHLPAERSGMAASATNTARQLGVVVGVAGLGAIINAHLTASVNSTFTGPLLGSSRESVLTILETGGHGGQFDLTTLVEQPIFAPFVAAFLTGVRLALLVAVVLMLLAGFAVALVPEPGSGSLATPPTGT